MSGRLLTFAMGSGAFASPSSNWVEIVAARCPPAEKPRTPMRLGSSFSSRDIARTVRIAYAAS
jgi:hypothetical protein